MNRSCNKKVSGNKILDECLIFFTKNIQRMSMEEKGKIHYCIAVAVLFIC